MFVFVAVYYEIFFYSRHYDTEFITLRLLRIFSERELSSVRFVRPQSVKFFGDIAMPFGTLAIR